MWTGRDRDVICKPKRKREVEESVLSEEENKCRPVYKAGRGVSFKVRFTGGIIYTQ